MTERLETFEKGEAIEVPIERIETELAALWREAATAYPGDRPAPVTRASLWNFIVRVQGDAEFVYAKKLIDDISMQIPARVIVMRPERADADEDGTLRAWVEANWRRAEGGHGASGSDEVTLMATGRATSRLVSLVRSLLLADAPTAMMWIGAPPARSAPVLGLLGDIDRLIVDTRKLASESDLAGIDGIGRRAAELELVDLSWLGISPLRGLCAALFDPDPAQLAAVDRLRVVSGVRGTQARGLLAIGWLASRLGWQKLESVQGTPEIRRWRASRPSGGQVEIELATDTTRAAHHGVVQLTLQAGDRAWSLDRGGACIDVRGPDMPRRMQPARSHSDAELTVTALGPRGRDPVFRAALSEAARLAGARP